MRRFYSLARLKSFVPSQRSNQLLRPGFHAVIPRRSTYCGRSVKEKMISETQKILFITDHRQ